MHQAHAIHHCCARLLADRVLGACLGCPPPANTGRSQQRLSQAAELMFVCICGCNDIVPNPICADR